MKAETFVVIIQELRKNLQEKVLLSNNFLKKEKKNMCEESPLKSEAINVWYVGKSVEISDHSSSGKTFLLGKVLKVKGFW